MDVNNVNDEFKVCLCKGRMKGEILKVIKDNNIHDLKTLRELADAGNVCGGCSEDLESLIKIAWEE